MYIYIYIKSNRFEFKVFPLINKGYSWYVKYSLNQELDLVCRIYIYYGVMAAITGNGLGNPSSNPG